MAERVRALGGRAVATLAEFTKLARLKEHPGRQLAAREMLRDLPADHEALVQALRGDLEVVMARHGDAGTNDFLTGLME